MKCMKINIPAQVLGLMNRLERCGFEAFVVGGCVRDSLLGTDPKDWDICTPRAAGRDEGLL